MDKKTNLELTIAIDLVHLAIDLLLNVVEQEMDKKNPTPKVDPSSWGALFPNHTRNHTRNGSKCAKRKVQK